MTLTVGTERVGQRIYVTGNTYAVKDQLKSAGCHWDGERRQWWIGAAKASLIQSMVGQLDGAEAPKEDLSDRRVYSRVEYKGRTYYVIAESAERCRLTVLDGSLDFWADSAACKVLKRYQSRSRWGGYGRGQVEAYTTLGSIRDFIRESRAAEKEIAAGEVPAGYAVDLEDGGVKRISECDIPDR